MAFFLGHAHQNLLALATTDAERKAIQRLLDFAGDLDDLRCALRLYAPHRGLSHIDQYARSIECVIRDEEGR